VSDLDAEPVRVHDDDQYASDITFAGSSRLLAVAGTQLKLWDLNQEPAQSRVLKGHVGEVQCVAYHAATAMLVSGGKDGNVFLWNVSDANPLPRLLGKHTGSVLSVAFDRTGGLVAAGTSDGLVQLFRVRDASQEPLRLSIGVAPVYAVAFSPIDDVL